MDDFEEIYVAPMIGNNIFKSGWILTNSTQQYIISEVHLWSFGMEEVLYLLAWKLWWRPDKYIYQLCIDEVGLITSDKVQDSSMDKLRVIFHLQFTITISKRQSSLSISSTLNFKYLYKIAKHYISISFTLPLSYTYPNLLLKVYHKQLTNKYNKYLWKQYNYYIIIFECKIV